jgi:hypothetical protein
VAALVRSRPHLRSPGVPLVVGELSILDIHLVEEEEFVQKLVRDTCLCVVDMRSFPTMASLGAAAWGFSGVAPVQVATGEETPSK